MPLPPTRYIDAGPGAPLANPNVAMAQGAAMARMGQTIQHVGEVGFRIADKLQKIDDTRKATDLFTSMEQEAADFEIGLMKREDTEEWSGEWKQKADAWRQAAGESKLSPEGRAAFEERFAVWNTRKQIGFEATAANKSIELGRKATANAFEFHMGKRNYDEARQAINDASEWMDTPDREKALMQIDKTQRHDGILDSINADARGWMAANPADKPPADYDPVKWRQFHDFAGGIASDKDRVTSDGILDKIVSNNATLDDIKKSNLRPLEQKKLEDAYDRWNAEGAKAKREDPKNVSANVGKFYAGLSDWTPDPEGEDPAGVNLKMLIKEIPEGHPLREKMLESMNAREKRIGEEVKTKADQGRESLKLASERGDFGPTKLPEAPNIETRDAVKKGWLKDIPKLQGFGYSKEQAEEIRAAAEKDPALGQKTYTKLWEKRSQQSVNATPFDIAVSDALRSENGELKWKANLAPEVMEAHENAARAYGEAVIDFEKWIKLNPDADDKAIGGKLRELGSKSAILEPIKRASGTVPGRATTTLPGETSMNLPEPLKTLAPTFRVEGKAHGLDPRLLAAIAMHETGNGTSSAFKNKNNAMGVSNSSGPISFDDSTASVAKMAKLLGSSKGPYKNANTLAEIAAIYAPSDADNDPNDLNKYWLTGVSKYLRQLGGDPDKIFTKS